MEEVAFDLVKKYPPVEPDDFASGKIQNAQHRDVCVTPGSDRQVIFCRVFCCRNIIIAPCNSPGSL